VTRDVGACSEHDGHDLSGKTDDTAVTALEP
jgi:hypothetical protein